MTNDLVARVKRRLGDPRNRLHWLRRHLFGFVWGVLRFLLLLGICYIILYPILVKLSASFMPAEDLHDVTVKWVPHYLTLDNFRMVFDILDYRSGLLNTLILSVGGTALTLLSCTLAAYGFARFRFPGRGLIFALVILTLVVPPQTYMLPMYMYFKNLGLINSLVPLLLLPAFCMGLKNGLYIFILRQVFRNMPQEIEESAKVDGAGALRIFGQIMLPGAVPALITVGLITFVWTWNDTFYPTLLAENVKLLSNMLSGIGGTLINYFGGWEHMDMVYTSVITNAAALLMMLPLILLYIVLQRYFIEGVERTGVVG